MPQIKIISTGEVRDIPQSQYDEFQKSAGASNFEFLGGGSNAGSSSSGVSDAGTSYPRLPETLTTPTPESPNYETFYQDARSQALKQRQDQLGAIDKIYEQQLADETSKIQESGKRDLARTNTISAITGMMGSPVAVAAAGGSERRTSEQLKAASNAIAAQKSIAVQNFYNAVDNIASKQAEIEYAASREDAAKALQDRQNAALNAIGQAATDGISWDALQQHDSETLNKLINASGKTAFEVYTLYNQALGANKPTHQYSWQGDNLIDIQTYPDGTMKTKTFTSKDLGIPVGTDFQTLALNNADGSQDVYWYDTKTAKPGVPPTLTKLGTNAAPQDTVKTQVIDMGTHKVLINSETGKTIQDFGEVVTPPDVVEIDGVDSIWNPTTKQYEPINTPNQSAMIENLKSKLTLTDELLAGVGEGAAVGSMGISRIFSLPGNKQNFIAAAKQLGDIEFLDKLINVKNQGATFGALSDNEGQALRDAATKLNSWAKKDDSGKILYYQIDQDHFEAEVNKLKGGYEKAMSRLQGDYKTLDEYYQVNPEQRSNIENMIKENPTLDDNEILQILTSKTSFNNDLGKSKNYLSNYGSITGMNGSPYWKWGLDIDLKKGDPVYSPVGGTVIAVGSNAGFGNQVKIKGTDGREYWLSHLDGFKVKVGQKITPGSLVGLGGNTGKVIAQGGGDGSHLDITVKDSKGNYIAAKDVYKLLS